MNEHRDLTAHLVQDLQDVEFRKGYGAEVAKLDFAIAVAEARRRADLTQQEAAALSGVSQAYLSKLESGEANPTVGQVGSIVGAWLQRLQPSVGDLVAGAQSSEKAEKRRRRGSERVVRTTSA